MKGDFFHVNQNINTEEFETIQSLQQKHGLLLILLYYLMLDIYYSMLDRQLEKGK